MTDVEAWSGSGGGLDIDTIRKTLAPDATDRELFHFAAVCRRLDLDPYAEQIYLVPRKRKLPSGIWETTHKPTIAIAGRRAIADRTGRLQGIEGPEWCGPRRYDGDGNKLPLGWAELWDEDGIPYAARCFVWPAGWIKPANGTVKWSEFAQYTGADRKTLTPFWHKSPSHMLGKVAEALALRRAFPEVDAAVTAANRDVHPDHDADDAAVIAEVEAGDRVPAHVYDAEPEANIHADQAESYRYDPGDAGQF